MCDYSQVEEQVRLVDDWLREYVSVGDSRVGRSGPVCPFMPRALKQDAVQIRVRFDIDGSSESELIDELRAEISDFSAAVRPQSSSGVVLESRVVALPGLDSAGWQRLDAVYESLKYWAVQSGTMVGKFHPQCDDRAVRNSGFQVSVSPVAMVAIRHMAPHDILFLNDSEHWFREYDARFGSHFQRNQVRDSLLLSLYRAAHERHSVST